LFLLAASGALVGAPSCETLSKLSLPNTAITSAQIVAAGEFVLPAGRGPAPLGRGPAPSFKDLPAFCRVQATLTPSSDSDLKIEVWLPASGWNRKFQAVGNGGWAGTISYVPLGAAVRRGYATASTDTGHVRGSASFALGHPEKLTDFAYRAVHEMTVISKAIITNFYG
jgi:feruloyl esterase